MRRISPKVEPASAQNVRVVRSFRTSAATLAITARPPCRR